MNTPNPLIPKGSLLEQRAKGKPHLRVACIIVAIHMVFLGGLLIQGCKKEDINAKANPLTNDSALPPLDQSSLYPTNAPQPTNLLPQDLTQTSAPPATNPAPQSVPLLPPVESAAPGPAREYVVVKRDTFSTIRKKFGVSWSPIAKAQPGVDSTRLKVGQKLVVPAPASPTIATAAASNSGENLYVVKAGDTLSRIARANGASVNEIKALNGLKTDRIKAGDKLKMPVAKPAPVTATPGSPGNL